MYTLYGDGIHDDFPAIQELIDSGVREIVLPEPKVCYLISKTLTIPSNFRLVLPRYAEIKLADGANCIMVSNKTFTEGTEFSECGLVDKLHEMASDPSKCVHDFEISGGIWNLNNKGQAENPLWTGVSGPKNYIGLGLLFCNVKDFKISNITLKDPVNFALTLATASYFTVEDITFDFNDGNPTPVNMDGVHLYGNCHYGTIRNLKGTCYDDLVAINACEGTVGPITNMEVNGIYSTDCHSAVRIHTIDSNIENIHISNVFGTYYQYCIGLTNIGTPTTGHFDSITLDNIYASKAERFSRYCKDDQCHYALIYIQEYANIKNLKIDTFHRREFKNPIFTIATIGNSRIENLILENITIENHTDEKMYFLSNDGLIGNLTMKNIRIDSKTFLYRGEGSVNNLN